MAGKDIEIRLVLGSQKRSRMERSMIVDAFVNTLGLALGGYKDKDTLRTDSLSEPALIKVRVAAHHENSAVVAQVLKIAANCKVELQGPVAITPVEDPTRPPSGYFD